MATAAWQRFCQLDGLLQLPSWPFEVRTASLSGLLAGRTSAYATEVAESWT
jgi:hypothetical protein